MPINIAIIENNIIATNTIRKKLASEFLAKGYKVNILTSGTLEELNIARENGFNIIDIGHSTQDLRDIIRYMFRMFKGLKSSHADVCLTFTIRPAIWGNIITRILNIPTITNITGIGPLFLLNNIPYRVARFLYKFVLKKTAKIFFQNYDDINIFIKNKFAHPSIVERVPGSGIDYEFYSPREKKNKNGKFVFIFIGRLVKDKGILEYVEAAKKLSKKLTSVEFQVLGPIWSQNLKNNTVSESELKHWVDEGMIKYLGESKDIRDYLAEADCLVLPSYREGMSNVLLEAASMEKPCITTDATGCRDIVENGLTGYLCQVQDVLGLVKTMESMYYLPEKQREIMGKNARNKVIREFDKKIVVNAYLKAIEQCCKVKLG
jgi:glycosyltransferase involved in cell wall biosynthesis